MTEPMPAAAHLPVGRSPLALGARRFTANRAALVGLGVLILVAGACFGTWAVTTPATSVPRVADAEPHPWPPSIGHPFGTDTNGRDMLVRTLRGGAVSLGVGLMAAAVSVTIGTFYGAVSGLAGGPTDRTMMRLVDVLYGLPYILLVLLLMSLFQSRRPVVTFAVLFMAIGAFTWLTMARIVRGQVLRLREEEFVTAARALGVGRAAILLRHLLPNIVGPIIVCATLTVPVAILQESFLSFLGLGISPPYSSWGGLASDAVKVINPLVGCWWLGLFPCAFLGLTLLCLNFVGDGLRDAFDPKMLSRDAG